MRQDVAETICKMVDDVFDKLQILTEYVIDNGEDLPIERMRLAIGTCVAELDLDVLDPIYREYPHLKPSGLPDLTCRKCGDDRGRDD